MYDGFRFLVLADYNPGRCTRTPMKKWLLLATVILLLAGCSASKMWKWMDKMDWEREDQTVRTTDFLVG